MKNEIILSEEEVRINISVRKDCLVMALASIIPFLATVGLLVLILLIYKDLKPVYYLIVCFFIGFYLYDPVIKGLFWKYIGERYIVFDSKYVFISDSIGKKAIHRVLKVSNISQISIDYSYQLTFWERIRAFLTRDSGGCIAIIHDGKTVRLGYGLSIEEAKKLLSILKAKKLINSIEN
ncbi:MAG: hypothetical protein LBH32_05690 [Dysgonamonadaceae bacterium]|jgi:hypothetical protein|nr:hypothetical protein [Dysgonamonadaceae bacterium]